jgi:DNA-binding transcriptional regulator YbjK
VSGEHLRPAPDPCYPAHCIYRRHIAKEQTEQIAALTAERDLANEERAVLCKDCNRHEAFDENVKLLAEVERLQKEYRELNTFFQDVRRSLTDTGIELIEENTTLHQRCEMLEEALKEIADNRGISTGNLREITQQALAEGNVIDRTHEECVECSLEKRNPPECNGHVAGPSACSKFNALKDGKEKE